MKMSRPRRILASLDVIPFGQVPEDPAWLNCTLCREPLALNQPDTDSPEHLVGVCEGCRRWHLIQLEPDGDGAILVVLPEWGWFQAAGADPPRPGGPPAADEE